MTIFFPKNLTLLRGGSRTAATSKMKRFVRIVNGWKPLTIITKHFILDVAAVLDPPLSLFSFFSKSHFRYLQGPIIPLICSNGDVLIKCFCQSQGR